MFVITKRPRNMSGTDKLKNIEQQVDVNSIKYKGLIVWPVLRYYFCVKHTSNNSPARPNKTILNSLFKNLFFGFKNYFRKHDYVFITSSNQRVKIENKYIDKCVDEIAQNLSKSWVLELPIKGHYKKDMLPPTSISSKYPLYIMTWLFSKLIFTKKIEGEEKVKEILRELDISVDYKSICKVHYAQYKLMLFLCKWKKFKAAFVVCHYTNMGYIRALQELNIPVIEIQHGLIATNHCAYNIYTHTDLSCYPNYLLTFGKKEKHVFEGENLFMSPNKVFPVGHLYIDYISSEYGGDNKLKELQNKYRKTVAVVSQNHPIENKLIQFIKKVSELDETILYVFVPRTYTKIAAEYGFKENVILAEWLNVYQIIWHADIHSTVFSTCALEAPSIGVRNLLINIENMSKTSFKDKLDDGQITMYADNPCEYMEMIETMTTISKAAVIEKNASIIVPNYKLNIQTFIKDFKIE